MHELVNIFLERVHPHVWLISNEVVAGMVDKAYRDPPEAHILDLCSLLLVISIGMYYQPRTAITTIPVD